MLDLIRVSWQLMRVSSAMSPKLWQLECKAESRATTCTFTFLQEQQLKKIKLAIGHWPHQKLQSLWCTHYQHIYASTRAGTHGDLTIQSFVWKRFACFVRCMYYATYIIFSWRYLIKSTPLPLIHSCSPWLSRWKCQCSNQKAVSVVGLSLIPLRNHSQEYRWFSIDDLCQPFSQWEYVQICNFHWWLAH